MRNKLGTICMLLGAVLLLAALSLFLWNLWEDRQAGRSAESLLPRVRERIAEPVTEETGDRPVYPDPYQR